MRILSNFFWNLYAICYDVLLKFGPYLKMFDKIIEQLDLDRNKKIKVLDLACGTGNLEFLLSKKNFNNIEIDALDFSSSMLKRAKSKNKNCNFYSCDISVSLPFENESFDRVVVINVFHLLPEPEKVLAEIVRILKTDGKIVLVSLKDDYQMSFILKSWKHDHEPFEKWKSKSVIFWFYLIFRSFGFSSSAFKFIFVAIFNKIIDKNIKGFSYNQLRKMFVESGLLVEFDCLVYGNQEFLFTLKKPSTMFKMVKNENEFNEAISLRREVFDQEFKIPKESDIDCFDLNNDDVIDFIIVTNHKIIGTIRFTKIYTLEDFRWKFSLRDENNFFSFFPCLEVSRFAFSKEQRSSFDLPGVILLVYEYANYLGFEYTSGAIRIEFFHLLKRMGVSFDSTSEEFDYHKVWKIITFFSSVEKSFQRLKRK